MNSSTKIIFVVILQFISTIKLTSGDCQWGDCNSWEYCCGDNRCCANSDRVYNNIIIAVSIFFAVLVFCCSVFFVCRYFCRIVLPVVETMCGNYTNLSHQRGSSTTNLTVPDVEYEERMYSDPPPPYSEVVGMGK